MRQLFFTCWNHATPPSGIKLVYVLVWIQFSCSFAALLWCYCRHLYVCFVRQTFFLRDWWSSKLTSKLMLRHLKCKWLLCNNFYGPSNIFCSRAIGLSASFDRIFLSQIGWYPKVSLMWYSPISNLTSTTDERGFCGCYRRRKNIFSGWLSCTREHPKENIPPLHAVGCS